MGFIVTEIMGKRNERRLAEKIGVFRRCRRLNHRHIAPTQFSVWQNRLLWISKWGSQSSRK